ncbi:GntP family permease [Marinobacterium aestuariivivens]|uniref:GntP family permease n=1 Tax=Marinobacterium aestuariivivens TaxID=1698799 RepID=A0ABW2A952_9GAMM
MSIAGILLALALLIYLAYRGFSVLVLAPVVSAAAVLFEAGSPLLASYTQVFMPAAGRFIALYFPLFLLGAIFGRFMEDSGAANAIAGRLVRQLGKHNAILSIVLACAILTYGGVSLFVVAFAIYPIAAEIFRTADLPKRLIPATIALGAFTFTMTALPGTPAIQNAIPMPYFNTTPSRRRCWALSPGRSCLSSASAGSTTGDVRPFATKRVTLTARTGSDVLHCVNCANMLRAKVLI